jgi:hypothetical protein
MEKLMNKTTNTAAVNRLYEALILNGEKLTAKQISARYGIANPYDTVYTLRREGFAIYLNSHVDSKGRMTNKYTYGQPSRKIIAAGYKALAAGLA